MPIRFRRTFKILPGVKVNVNKGGVSLTLGPRGLRFTLGKNGITRTIGIPGTGISETSYIAKNEPDSEEEKNSKKNGRKRKRKHTADEDDEFGCFPCGCILFPVFALVVGYFAAIAYGIIPQNYLSDVFQGLTQWLQNVGL